MFLAVAVVLMAFSLSLGAAAVPQKSFSSAEEAVKHAVAAAREMTTKSCWRSSELTPKKYYFQATRLPTK